MDKDIELILTWLKIDPESIDLDEIYRSPKFWIALIIIFSLLGTGIALS